MKEAEASVSEAASDPIGLLRVQASLSFCLLHLTPLFPPSRERHPRIRVEIVAANRYLDIIENGIDVAVRTRRIEADTQITIRRLAQTRRLSPLPDYLARMDPRDPKPQWTSPSASTRSPTTGTSCGTGREPTITVPIEGTLNANDGQLIRVAALDGLGISRSQRTSFMRTSPPVALSGFSMTGTSPRLTMNIAYPTKAFLPAKTRLFIDFLVEDFRHEYERHLDDVDRAKRRLSQTPESAAPSSSGRTGQPSLREAACGRSRTISTPQGPSYPVAWIASMKPC